MCVFPFNDLSRYFASETGAQTCKMTGKKGLKQEFEARNSKAHDFPTAKCQRTGEEEGVMATSLSGLFYWLID